VHRVLRIDVCPLDEDDLCRGGERSIYSRLWLGKHGIGSGNGPKDGTFSLDRSYDTGNPQLKIDALEGTFL
jgi:hypothetical protein